MLDKILKLFPNSVLYRLSKLFPNYSEIINTIRLNSFLEKTDFEHLDMNDKPICEIKQGEWEYPLFNVCFIENMLKNITYCIANGNKPVVSFLHPTERTNLWEQFLEQPFFEQETNKNKEKTECDLKAAPIYFPTFPTSDDIKKYGKLYQAFVKPNAKFKTYFEDEYNELIKGKKVLGVLCRGTDYVATKPKSHPVQPKTDDVISFVRSKLDELNCDFIYLATEEMAIHNKFENAFPGKIITNKRNYFDKYYQMNNNDSKTLISAVHFERENDNYYKALEYFSSIFLLSNCKSLIAGNCGGSRAALYLNGGKYEYSYLFNLGVY